MTTIKKDIKLVLHDLMTYYNWYIQENNKINVLQSICKLKEVSNTASLGHHCVTIDASTYEINIRLMRNMMCLYGWHHRPSGDHSICINLPKWHPHILLCTGSDFKDFSLTFWLCNMITPEKDRWFYPTTQKWSVL